MKLWHKREGGDGYFETMLLRGIREPRYGPRYSGGGDKGVAPVVAVVSKDVE